MHSRMFRNGTPFPMQKLKVIKGKIPQSILGSYIKNGPGLLTIQNQVLPHWFIGNSGLLKIEFHDGMAYGKYKIVETPAYKRDVAAKSFNRPSPFFGQFIKLIGMNYNPQLQNSVSTSVFRQPNSEKFFALYESGLPFKMQEKNLEEEGFENFGFLENGFSAHPKIDPDNGDIYNIGFNKDSFYVYRMTKDFKLISKTSSKLRIPQSIHDCCLAGNYFVVFENPLKINLWKLLKRQQILKCYSVDYNYGKTIVHIWKKQTLQFVNKLQLNTLQPFIIYHFTNGFVENNKIHVEYVKYPGKNAQQLLELVQYAPNYASKTTEKKKFHVESELQTISISLEDFSHTFKSIKNDCEFPSCQDKEVGKKWRYSYFISKDKGDEIFNFNKLAKYDRFEDKVFIKHFPGCCIVEPALISTSEGLFILVLKTSLQRCSLQLLQGDKFQLVAQMQLPEYIPFGFHGRWIEMQNKNTLQSENY